MSDEKTKELEKQIRDLVDSDDEPYTSDNLQRYRNLNLVVNCFGVMFLIAVVLAVGAKSFITAFISFLLMALMAKISCAIDYGILYIKTKMKQGVRNDPPRHEGE